MKTVVPILLLLGLLGAGCSTVPDIIHSGATKVVIKDQQGRQMVLTLPKDLQATKFVAVIDPSGKNWITADELSTSASNPINAAGNAQAQATLAMAQAMQQNAQLVQNLAQQLAQQAAKAAPAVAAVVAPGSAPTVAAVSAAVQAATAPTAPPVPLPPSPALTVPSVTLGGK